MTTLRCALGSHHLRLVTVDQAECRRKNCDLTLYKVVDCHCREQWCEHWSPLRPHVAAPPPEPELVYPPRPVTVSGMLAEYPPGDDGSTMHWDQVLDAVLTPPPPDPSGYRVYYPVPGEQVQWHGPDQHSPISHYYAPDGFDAAGRPRVAYPDQAAGRHHGGARHCRQHNVPDCTVCWPHVPADYDGSTYP